MGRKILLAAVVDGDQSNERSNIRPITPLFFAAPNARETFAR
jgi:hypothetical protein